MSFAEAFAAEAVVTVDAVVAACRAPASESQDSRAKELVWSLDTTRINLLLATSSYY